MEIAAPDVYWEDGHLLSAAFQDVYSSRADALAESRYVFLEQSGYLAATKQAADCVIAETGFGTGLNFLSVWQAWRAAGNQHCLHFISVEKFPLSLADIDRSLSAWQELAELKELFLKAYPIRRSGFYRMYFDQGRVQLSLYLGDVSNFLQQLIARVDFWFLDGFAPKFNQAMWSDAVCGALARLSHAGTGLSTFTAVGAVRRALQANGFAMEKVPGFGNKREMLRGVFQDDAAPQEESPCFALPVLRERPQRLAIIGGGLAGTSTAFMAQQRGIDCTLYDGAGIAQQASGNKAGIAGPPLNADNQAFAQFYFSAWQLARQLWQQHDVFADVFVTCGTHHELNNEQERQRAKRVIEQCAGLDPWAILFEQQLRIPTAMLVSPQQLCQAYMQVAQAHSVVENVEHIDLNVERKWCVRTATGVEEFDALVIANAQAALQFPQCAQLSLQHVRGQLLQFDQPIADNKSILQSDQYMTPWFRGSQVLGATFQRDDKESAARQGDTDFLLEQGRRKWNVPISEIGTPRVSFRSCGPDRMPLVGPLVDCDDFIQRFAELRHGRAWQTYDAAHYLPHCYVSLGHGSRGIVGSILAAACNVAFMCGDPLPISAAVWQAIAPQRFWYRDLRRGLM